MKAVHQETTRCAASTPPDNSVDDGWVLYLFILPFFKFSYGFSGTAWPSIRIGCGYVLQRNPHPKLTTTAAPSTHRHYQMLAATTEGRAAPQRKTAMRGQKVALGLLHVVLPPLIIGTLGGQTVVRGESSSTKWPGACLCYN